MKIILFPSPSTGWPTSTHLIEPGSKQTLCGKPKLSDFDKMFDYEGRSDAMKVTCDRCQEIYDERENNAKSI